jgi:hypothetical protein
MEYINGDKGIIKNDISEKIHVEIEHVKHGTTDGSLLGNEKESVTYKHKLFHTACVFFSMFALV